MRLLAFDTCTEACSAALLLDGDLRLRCEYTERGHAELLLPMIDALLAEAGLLPADLDGLAFGRGPGAFTGLRIAAGLAQGLAAGNRLPVLPVSNLAAVAAAAARSAGAAQVLACMDARMGQVYWGAYDCTGDAPVAMGPEHLANPEAVEPPGGVAWFGAGHGFSAHPQLAMRLGASLAGVDASILPHAEDIARIAAVDYAAGKGLGAAQGLPVYLRDDVVHRR